MSNVWTPQRRAGQAEFMREVNARPDAREKLRQSWTPERRAAQAERMRQMRQDPVIAERMRTASAERGRKQLTDPAYREKLTEGLRVRLCLIPRRHVPGPQSDLSTDERKLYKKLLRNVIDRDTALKTVRSDRGNNERV